MGVDLLFFGTVEWSMLVVICSVWCYLQCLVFMLQFLICLVNKLFNEGGSLGQMLPNYGLVVFLFIIGCLVRFLGGTQTIQYNKRETARHFLPG